MRLRAAVVCTLIALLVSGLFLASSRWVEASRSPVAALSIAAGHSRTVAFHYVAASATRKGSHMSRLLLVHRQAAALTSASRAEPASFGRLDRPARPAYLVDTDFWLTGMPFTSPYLQSEGPANAANGPYGALHPGQYAGLNAGYQGAALVGDTTFEYQGSGFGTSLSANAAYLDVVGYLGPRSAVPLTDCTSDVTHDPCTIGGMSDSSNSGLYVAILVGKCLAETSGTAPNATWDAAGDSIVQVIANNAVALEDQERSICTGSSSTSTAVPPSATPVPTAKPAATSTPVPASTPTRTATSLPTSTATVVPTHAPPAALGVTIKGTARVGKDATLKVTVRDTEDNHHPVHEARVTLDGHGAGISKVMKARTNGNGVATFSKVHPKKKGTIRFRASAAGFKDGTASIQVKR